MGRKSARAICRFSEIWYDGNWEFSDEPDWAKEKKRRDLRNSNWLSLLYSNWLVYEGSQKRPKYIETKTDSNQWYLQTSKFLKRKVKTGGQHSYAIG